jgi:hypothetical protein
MDKYVQGHISIEQMDRYVNGDMGVEESYEADCHMGGCDECAQKVRTLRPLNYVWKQWTAGSHGQARKDSLLVSSLKKAAAQNPKLQGRISRWLERWGTCAGGAVKVVFRVPDEITRVITGGMETLLKPQPRWRFAYATALPPVRGIRTRGGPRDKTKVRAEGTPGAEVTVDETSGGIEVRFSGLTSGQLAPLVLLISDDKGRDPLVLAPERDPETDLFVARFQKVPPGRYSLIIEPL